VIGVEGRMPNALIMLKADHRTLETLFKKFERMTNGGVQTKKKLVDQIVRELAIHTAIEEQLFYPAIRKASKEATDLVLEALEEHHVAKWTLSEIARMNPNDERFEAKMCVLIANVRRHVKEEERAIFAVARKKLDRAKLEALGSLLERAKKAAPTRPHPRMPDTPPGNFLTGMGEGLMDRALDLISGRGKRAIPVRARVTTNGRRASSNGRRAHGHHPSAH